MRVFTVNASTHINVKYIQLRAIHYIGNPKQYFCWHFVLHPSTDAKQRSGGHCGRRHTDLNFTTSPLTTPQQLFCIHLSPTGSLSHTPVCKDTNASTHPHTKYTDTRRPVDSHLYIIIRPFINNPFSASQSTLHHSPQDRPHRRSVHIIKSIAQSIY